MKGFFTKQETKSESRPDGKVYSCISCGGFRNCENPKMLPQGSNEKGIMIIGPGISPTDDRRNMPFQGSTGRILRKAFDKFGIDLENDCMLLNITRCLFTENEESRNPNNYEIQCCRKYVFQAIKEHKPKLIFLLGQEAVYSVIGSRWKKDLGSIDKWRGWTIPDQEIGAWLCPIFDPLFTDNPKKPEITTVWEQDIENALLKLDAEFPKYVEPKIEYLEDDLSVLNTITHDVVFDIETTGLKPHAEGHKIICASVAVSERLVYVFMLPKSKKKQKPFIDLLENKQIAKGGQNIKFEDTWCAIRLNTTVQNWKWDTMLATHILDNRPDITGLKIQTYLQWGVIDYDSEISPYLKAINPDDANSLNRIEELLEKPDGKQKLLKYCALDSFFEYKLGMIQKELIESQLPF